MKLLEYEAKQILKAAGLPVPYSSIVTSPSDSSILPAVLKSQVPVGGRGKAGGVRKVTTEVEYTQAVTDILQLEIKGFRPTVLLAESTIAISKEHYVSLLIDRESSSIRLIAHKNGGIEVEDNNTDGFLNIPISDESIDACANQLAAHLGYEVSELTGLLQKFYDAFIANDAMLLEVNPLIRTKGGEFICGDCKMELDDAATFRHPEWSFEQTSREANFVTLDPDGTIATVANGAGLAMATVDAVAARGMSPANFLDIGGGANTESVLVAFKKIMEFPHIDAIVVNIFAGITRCDEVAKAIIAAKKQIPALPHLYIRLAGTNFEDAVSLLSHENIPTLATLEECLTAVQKANHA